VYHTYAEKQSAGHNLVVVFLKVTEKISACIQRQMTFRKSQTTSIDQCAETPPGLMRNIYKDFGLKWDPCPPNYQVDGLTRKWRSGAYVNPPFKDTRKWLAKAQSEKTYAVFLIPFMKLHRQFITPLWVSISAVWVFSSLVKFTGYNRPLNKAIALVSVNKVKGPIDRLICQLYSWVHMKDRTMAAVMAKLTHYAPDAVLVLSNPSKSLPPLLEKDKFVVLGPARLDLKWIRDHLHIFDEIIICPTLKMNKSDKENQWLPSIILVKGVRIAKHLDVHAHSVPVYQYQPVGQ